MDGSIIFGWICGILLYLFVGLFPAGYIWDNYKKIRPEIVVAWWFFYPIIILAKVLLIFPFAFKGLYYLITGNTEEPEPPKSIE